MKTKIYNQKGKETGEMELPEKIFNIPFNRDMVHEVIVSMQSNARAGIAHTKDRSAVRGGGKKPWRQKGTGRARHGSRRSPLWRGGGVTFGPTSEENFKRKINKKIKVKALYMLLSAKMRDGELLFVDRIDVPESKTKNAKRILQDLSAIRGFTSLRTKRRNAAYLYMQGKNTPVERGFNNFGNVSVAPLSAMNPLDVAAYKYIVITEPEKSVAFLEGKMKKSAR